MATSGPRASEMAKPPSLRSRLLHGAVWLLGGDATAKGIGVLKTAILGRLLSPTDFGLAAIGQLSIQWLDYFSESGFNTSLILKTSDPAPFLNTAWTVQLIRGIGLSALLFVGAPLVAKFFGNAEATPVVRALALIMLLRGANSPAIVCLRRDLKFSREAVWRMSSPAASIVTAVPLALIYRSFWALVLAMVAGQLAETIVSYWALPFRPRLEFDRHRIREMTHIGKWIFWNNFFLFPARFLDNLVVGRFLGTTALGFYSIACYVALMIPDQLATHTGTMLLPAFTKLHMDEDLRRGFLRSFGIICGLLMALGCVFTVLAGLIVRVAVGPKWALAAPLVRILVWCGVFGAIGTVTNQLLLRIGKPHAVTFSSFLRASVLAILVYPFVRLWGAHGVAFAATLAALVAMLVQGTLALRKLRVSPWDVIESMFTSVRDLTSYLYRRSLGLVHSGR